MTSNRIRDTLSRIGAIREDRLEVLATRTRDVDPLTVHRDRASGVIFIDGHYAGDAEYRSGAYRDRAEPTGATPPPSLEDIADTERRLAEHRAFIAGRDICDFGCGAGSFLKAAAPLAGSACGIELQDDRRAALNASRIACHASLDDAPGSFDTVFLFHVLEHLPDPATTLAGIRERLKEDGRGRIVVEVPHARDMLIEPLGSQAFLAFTLWSQHLVLHTRESLRLLMADAGFRDIQIAGVQRYGLANHLTWLSKAEPGGHRATLAAFETPALARAYAEALARIDATDTLVAIASR